MNFFLFNFCLPGPFNFICSISSLPFFLALDVANADSPCGAQSKKKKKKGDPDRRHN